MGSVGEARGRRARKRWTIVAACGAALAGASCSGAARPAPSSAPVVDVAMDEYRFDLDGAVPAGRVVFRARNLGRLDHELLLVELPEDFPPVREQLESAKRRAVSNVARVAVRKPGTTGTFAADLVPGRYAMVCFVQDADGGQHAQKGMSAEFRITR